MKYRVLLLVIACAWISGCLSTAGPRDERPPLVRVENFTVPPSTGPVTHVVVRNLNSFPCEAVVQLQGPEGWQLHPEQQTVELAPHETKRVPFTIEKAKDRESNSYRMEALVSGGAAGVTRYQDLVCASAPRFTAVIDGDPAEWKDAIPATFSTRGKKTTIRTYWDRRYFYLLFEVEEERLIGAAEVSEGEPFDALQLAVSRRTARTGTAPAEPSSRHEFLVARVSSAPERAVCYSLLQPGDKLAVTQELRALAPLACTEARAVVKRRGPFTVYECAIPFSAMGTVRPTVGREFCFSFLVHDPDGTGVRDWGAAAGLWPEQRNRLAWCTWSGAKWEGVAPFDGKIEWGMCSSKH